MAMTIRFNTGRLYTQFGQRITAYVHDDGTVDFFDKDRGIDGRIRDRLPQWVPADNDPIARWVMGRYDRCDYDGFLPLEARDAVAFDPQAKFEDMRI